MFAGPCLLRCSQQRNKNAVVGLCTGNPKPYNISDCKNSGPSEIEEHCQPRTVSVFARCAVPRCKNAAHAVCAPQLCSCRTQSNSAVHQLPSSSGWENKPVIRKSKPALVLLSSGPCGCRLAGHGSDCEGRRGPCARLAEHHCTGAHPSKTPARAVWAHISVRWWSSRSVQVLRAVYEGGGWAWQMFVSRRLYLASRNLAQLVTPRVLRRKFFAFTRHRAGTTVQTEAGPPANTADVSSCIKQYEGACLVTSKQQKNMCSYKCKRAPESSGSSLPLADTS